MSTDNYISKNRKFNDKLIVLCDVNNEGGCWWVNIASDDKKVKAVPIVRSLNLWLFP